MKIYALIKILFKQYPIIGFNGQSIELLHTEYTGQSIRHKLIKMMLHTQVKAMLCLVSLERMYLQKTLLT